MISFANAPGNLFNVLGRLAGLITALRTYQGNLRSVLVGVNGAGPQLAAQPDLQALIGGAYLTQLQTPEPVTQLAQQVAAQWVNRVVFNDNPQLSQNLTTLNVVTSIAEVIRQMRAAGASVLAQTVGATPALFSANAANAGNGVVIASTKRPFDGLSLELMLAETMKVTCTADSYIGGASAGNEQFLTTGAGSEPDPFALDWPLGSNASQTTNAVNGDASNSQGNLLTNSGWGTFTVANVPDDWHITAGAAGVNVFSNNSILYTGGFSLQLTGDGATLTTLQQQFGADTAATLQPLTAYNHNLFIRRDGASPAVGILQVSLVDGSGAVINDAAGVPNSYQIDLTATGPLNTNFQSIGGTFRTPEILPSAIYLQYGMPVGGALSNGRSIYLDKTALAVATQSYTPFGCYLNVFSGSINFVQVPVGDYTPVVVTNSRGAGGTLSTWQTAWSLLFPSDSAGNGFLLPSSAGGTISDALIF